MLIIDTETTGLIGYRSDRVLEIGIVSFDEITRDVKPLYSSMVRYPDMDAYIKDYERRNGPIWAFQNTSLDPGDIKENGKDIDEVVLDFIRIVHGKAVTSYNVPFDFGKFLDYEPWNAKKWCVQWHDIMDLATKRVKDLARADALRNKELQSRLIDEWYEFPGKWVRSIDAYNALCPNDPAGSKRRQTHRALDDAIQEAYVLKAIWEATVRCS